MSDRKISVTMTEEEWTYVVEAIGSAATGIRNATSPLPGDIALAMINHALLIQSRARQINEAIIAAARQDSAQGEANGTVQPE